MIHIDKQNKVLFLARLFRDSVNAFISINNSLTVIESFSENLNQIKDLNDWHKLCTAMDLLQDTQMAKENFIKYKLTGPTKFHDIGEQYLRLFGILNSINIQKTAIETIASFTHHSNLKNLRNALDSTKIICLRHAVASHNIKTLPNKIFNEENTFQIVQIELGDENVTTFDKDQKFEKFNIVTLIAEFDMILHMELVRSIENNINKMKNINHEKVKLKEELEIAKKMLNDELGVFDINGNKYIIA